MLNTGKVFRNTLTPECAARLLLKCQSITKAKVTLKLGHDTDMSLEEPEAQELFLRMPSEHPVVFMRRGKLQNEYKSFYSKKYNNLLVQVTLTPRSSSIDYTNNPFEILDTFREVKTNMFYVIAPVCLDNIDESKKIISELPAESYVSIKLLTTKNIPGMTGIPEPGAELYDELCSFAEAKGHYVVSYLNCVVRSRLRLPFHKCGEFVSEHNIWQLKWSRNCPVRSACASKINVNSAERKINSALSDLQLTLAEPIKKRAYKTYNVVVNEDVNFGDEAYIRELTNLKVDLIKTGRKTGSSLSESIFNRWIKIGFFPVAEVHQLGKECYDKVQAYLKKNYE